MKHTYTFRLTGPRTADPNYMYETAREYVCDDDLVELARALGEMKGFKLSAEIARPIAPLGPGHVACWVTLISVLLPVRDARRISTTRCGRWPARRARSSR
jgi:hypothetical protein